jgi:hypothetical protein
MLEYKNNKADALVHKFIQNIFQILAIIAYFTASLKEPKEIP